MSFADTDLLPRATLRDILGGRARFIGYRCDARQPRGFLSPVEARVQMGIPYGDLRRAEAEYLERRSWRTDLGVMARALLASALSPSRRTEPWPRPFIVSARVDNLAIAAALDLILGPALSDRARLLFFVHAHALNLARFHPPFAELLGHADTLLPDGIGIRLAARMLGVAMRHNLNGTDLFPLVCGEAARKQVPVVMIGGAPGVAAECAHRMRADHPGLEVPVVAPGFFTRDDDAEEISNRIARLGRALVLVGMGSPRQEQWAWRHLRHHAGVTVLTVGGLFDFYSGRVRRAPIFWREAGLEWAYRLIQEPRRLAKRYLVGNPLFVALALGQLLRGRRV